MRSYIADFETTTQVDDCRVWAWCICSVDNPDFCKFGNDIASFMNWCERSATCNIYFHNLAFDGAFIMDYLERNGWKWIADRKESDVMT